MMEDLHERDYSWNGCGTRGQIVELFERTPAELQVHARHPDGRSLLVASCCPMRPNGCKWDSDIKTPEDSRTAMWAHLWGAAEAEADRAPGRKKRVRTR